ncbi:hypothetical protein LTR99_004586 [Exophiala xenobiotica]|uniref:Proteasome inhibitor PI31 subunit n=1 Tax=Vermiconidia calcicola TaxID=1690605 RepID=A0AAV9QBR5_9PEZI|nr:hypothetical protein H2202_003158 [Exophiala xenobiotica]KAK5539866.1 hypothetical protein LTR25_003571 [Vermiconidia calcicola]KAK5547014.1 hypothetical protein LTR23_003017 [Chaetothyriales sp. CCFEE 6169]KAK5210958.1 hypothetical protein LTR41_003570 [Exophiala xenobiotica]KAK5274704.1 hypothetical protein LTR96_001305 [Exophiala xenobiotica]
MAPAAASAMSTDTILDYMVKSLPTSSADNEQTQLVKDPYAAIALFSHACMLAVGFRLIGLGEDHRIEAQSDPQDAQPLPAEWSASSSYAFRYAHSQSSMEFLVKVNRLGGKVLVFGLGLGDDKTASFEVKAQDYISEGSIKEATRDSDKTSTLRNVFISNGRIADLASLFKLNIIQKLAPGISKAGYEDTTSTQEQPRRHEETRPPERDPLRDDHPPPARPYPFDDPLAAAPRRPQPPGDFPPPGFEDEYEINRPLRGWPSAPDRPSFGAIGERDLYPPGLGPHDPLRMGPGGGIRGGGGMHPTFDDPLFGGQGGQQPYDPRAPPGARYDPLGPGDGPPNLRGGRFPGGRGGGFGGNPFGGFGSGDFI